MMDRYRPLLRRTPLAAVSVLSLLTAFSFALGIAPTARAAFHVAVIDEVMSGNNGTETVQFVEIRMLIGGQGIVNGSKLSAFDASGTFSHVVLTVPSNVTGGSDRAWIMGSTDFAAASGITPDFTFDSSGGQGLIPENGMVCWGKPGNETNPDAYVDCVAYGAYVGPSNTHTTGPHPLNPFNRSLVRIDNTHNSAADFTCADPAGPENNAMAVGSIAGSEGCPVCGDMTVEDGEQCDGSDDAACPGQCLGSCLCPAVCGDDVTGGLEQCDGTDDGACPGACQVNCSCGPTAVLGKGDQKCVGAYVKASAKAVGAYHKAASGCVKDSTKGKNADAIADCTTADPKQKLAKAVGKVGAAIEKSCASLPFAIDCVEPCEATDAGGVSEAVDDTAELEACLECLSPATAVTVGAPAGAEGPVGQIYDGVTFATKDSDADLAKCQGSVAKALEKLITTQGSVLSKCIKTDLKTVVPPLDACFATDPKVEGAADKLTATIDAKCNGAAPFDAGVCSGISDPASLTACLREEIACAECLWSRSMTGQTIDCDFYDDATLNGSCSE